MTKKTPKLRTYSYQKDHAHLNGSKRPCPFQHSTKGTHVYSSYELRYKIMATSSHSRSD